LSTKIANDAITIPQNTIEANLSSFTIEGITTSCIGKRWR
jgi:hypothetical protein